MPKIHDIDSLQKPFADRHCGPDQTEMQAMLQQIGVKSEAELVKQTVPANILIDHPVDLGPGESEAKALAQLKTIAAKNKVYRSYIGMGYYNCVTPAVIQRNVLENPGWYTQYTPYQAEIAQGRLESLLNFQTMIMDLTGLDVANASVLDESTSAAEAMNVCDAVKNPKRDRTFFVADDCFPQTIDLVRTRAQSRGIAVEVGSLDSFKPAPQYFGVLIQYPNVDGRIRELDPLIKAVHAHDGLVVMAADILALTLLRSPGELGADLAVGSTQRLGVPLGFGGPHAGYMAAKQEHLRRLPGRIVGVSKDAEGKQVVRLSLQTREQHIRREKATSNICTAQVLLANMSAMYAVYHGPQGLKNIANRIHGLTVAVADGAQKLGHKLVAETYFDTVTLELMGRKAADVHAFAARKQLNLRQVSESRVGISLDETTSAQDVQDILECLNCGTLPFDLASLEIDPARGIVPSAWRKSAYLTHDVFNRYHSETELMRYMRRLETKDLSLTESMIPLGSCTMKLNAAAELTPVTWPEFNSIHPFAPKDQWQGYSQLFDELEAMLCSVTGFDAFSLQPNSGAQGEYAGLLAIRKYHESRGDMQRTKCLIPSSAHGTNPASAVMAGMDVVVVKCDEQGNVDMQDLQAKIDKHAAVLSALMITYPSTHGVFEESIVDICKMIHAAGGQVYMDGANMNAQIGVCLPGKFGPDVCHLNLHKTFCIPHGGGGPGVGPIGVKSHLRQFLPASAVVDMDIAQSMGTVSAAPWGSASILPISWMYIRMMGAEGLRRATEVAILNANYTAKRLGDYYPVLYTGKNGRVAHECIIDLRHIQKKTGITVEDVAKRLMDFGFHAPTIAWPVPGTMMIEPTESESKEEIDRFCDAMILIREEIAAIESGKADKANNLLKNAPHTAAMLAKDNWDFPYSRHEAAYKAPWLQNHKFWPSVARIDNAYGDRNFVCSCPGLDAYE